MEKYFKIVELDFKSNIYFLKQNSFNVINQFDTNFKIDFIFKII